MTFRVLPLTLAALVGAGCAAPEEVPAETQQAIIGGSTVPDGTDMNAVLLFGVDADGHSLYRCTGSLITRKIIMTAAHCVDDEAKGYRIFFADSYNPSTGVVGGKVDTLTRKHTALWRHPLYGSVVSGNDIALIAMDVAAPDSVPTLRYNRFRMTKSWLGRTIRFVGFGNTIGSGGESGDKLQGLGDVGQIVTDAFSNSSGAVQTCQGDSGGPVFTKENGVEVVTGVTSFGSIGCQASGASFNRVDTHLAEIRTFVAANDPQATANCGADGVCGIGCTAPDPDCPCAGDGLCTASCTTPDDDPDCPISCGKDNVCVRFGCAVKDPDCGDKGQGEDCTATSECASGLCVPSGGAKICALQCGAGKTCDDGFTCNSSSNICLEDSGGGCSTGGGSEAGYGGWLALGLAALFCARRRRLSA